jgi:cell division protein FtsN
MAMSPLVLDDEEAAAAERAESASAFRPEASQPSPVVLPAAAPEPAQPPADTTSQLKQQAPVYAAVVREDGEGDTEEVVRAAPPSIHGQWGIQVGAHASREKAETQLAQVQTQMKDILGKAKSAIVQLDVRGETFFRVRFGAFTPKKAEALCEQMQKRGVSCLVVTDGAWDQASARASLPIAVR